MYNGLLPSTGGFLLNPLRVLYLVIALIVFTGAWIANRRVSEISPVAPVSKDEE